MTGKLQLDYDIIVKDKNGKVTTHYHKKGKAFVTNLINLLGGSMRAIAGDGFTVTDTGGTARGLNNSTSTFKANAAVGTNAFGIQVGTGVTAVAIGNTALVTLIAEGVGAGQLNYSAMTINNPTTIGGTRQFIITRTVTNNSGASITINEGGLAVQGSNGAGPWNFLVDRFLQTFAVANLGSALITITISVTV